MVSFRSNAGPGRCGGPRTTIEPLNGGDIEDRWMSPPPVTSFDRILRQGGEVNAATKGPREDGASHGMTGKSGPLWPIDGAFLGSMLPEDTAAIAVTA